MVNRRTRGCIASDPTEDTERLRHLTAFFPPSLVASPPIRPRILKGKTARCPGINTAIVASPPIRPRILKGHPQRPGRRPFSNHVASPPIRPRILKGSPGNKRVAETGVASPPIRPRILKDSKWQKRLASGADVASPPIRPRILKENRGIYTTHRRSKMVASPPIRPRILKVAPAWRGNGEHRWLHRLRSDRGY